MKTVNGKPVAAFVLAGRRTGADDPLAGFEDTPHKAFIDFAGEPMIARVLGALADAGLAEALTVIGDADVLALAEQGDGAPALLEAGETLAETMTRAIAAAGERRALLVTTADHALLTPEMIEEFLSKIDPDTEIAAAVVEEKDYRHAYPDGPRTFLRFSDRAVSGANLFWVSGAAAAPLIAFWRKIESKRKNPLAMAAEIGVGTALAYATRTLSSKAATALLAKKTGVAAQLVALSVPEAAIDVDKPEDVALVRRILADRQD